MEWMDGDLSISLRPGPAAVHPYVLRRAARGRTNTWPLWSGGRRDRNPFMHPAFCTRLAGACLVLVSPLVMPAAAHQPERIQMCACQSGIRYACSIAKNRSLFPGSLLYERTDWREVTSTFFLFCFDEDVASTLAETVPFSTADLQSKGCNCTTSNAFASASIAVIIRKSFVSDSTLLVRASILLKVHGFAHYIW